MTPDPISRISQLESENERLESEVTEARAEVVRLNKHIGSLDEYYEYRYKREITRLKGQRDRLLAARAAHVKAHGDPIAPRLGVYCDCDICHELDSAIAECEAKP